MDQEERDLIKFTKKHIKKHTEIININYRIIDLKIYNNNLYV